MYSRRLLSLQRSTACGRQRAGFWVPAGSTSCAGAGMTSSPSRRKLAAARGMCTEDVTSRMRRKPERLRMAAEKAAFWWVLALLVSRRMADGGMPWTVSWRAIAKASPPPPDSRMIGAFPCLNNKKPKPSLDSRTPGDFTVQAFSPEGNGAPPRTTMASATG